MSDVHIEMCEQLQMFIGCSYERAAEFINKHGFQPEELTDLLNKVIELRWLLKEDKTDGKEGDDI